MTDPYAATDEFFAQFKRDHDVVDFERKVMVRWYSLDGGQLPPAAQKFHALLLWREHGSPDDFKIMLGRWVRVTKL